MSSQDTPPESAFAETGGTGVRELAVPAGTRLLTEGEPGHEAYMIVAGHVRITRAAAEGGGETVLAELGPGEIFGEMALVDAGPRTASATTIDACTLMAFDRRYLERAMADAAPALPYLLQTLIGRLRGAQQHCERTTGAAAAVLEELDRARWFDFLLAERQLRTYYHPLIGAADGEIAGYEVLLRCPGADGVPASPARLLDTARALGRSAEVTDFVLRAAGMDFVYHKLKGRGFLAVNVEAQELRDQHFAERITTTLAATGMPLSSLEVEITEHAVIDDMEGAVHRIRQLAELGVGVALDDFGTGYASLKVLLALPVTKLKLDQHFIRRVPEDPAARAVVRTVVELARQLDIKTVAEGVETEEIAQAMRDIGVDYLQGFLFGRPAPAEQVFV